MVNFFRCNLMRGGFGGIWLFLWCWLPLAQVQAQFGVAVVSDTSPTSIARTQASLQGLVESTHQTLAQLRMVAQHDQSFAGQVAEYAKTASRWVETVQQYTNQIFQFSRQFTNLNGILTFGAKELGLKYDTLKALGDMMRAFDAILVLKDQFEHLLETRLALVRDWEARAQAGIFNPQQDWADLREYLKSGLGREQVSDDLLLHIGDIDPEYARWQEEMKRLRKTEAELIAEQKLLVERIRHEQGLAQDTRGVTTSEQGGATVEAGRVSSSVEIVLALNTNLKQTQGQLIEVQKQIQELLDKMEKRYAETFWRMYQQWEKATAVGDTTEGWQAFGNIKLQKLGDLVDYTGPVTGPANLDFGRGLGSDPLTP